MLKVRRLDLHFSLLAGPHPRSLSLGGFAPRSGRRRCWFHNRHHSAASQHDHL